MIPIVQIIKTIPAPVEKVYEAWLKPELFSRWFLPDKGVRLGKVEAETREGGQFLIEMMVEGQLLPHRGSYKKIVRNKELVFTWVSAMTENKESLVTINFQDEKGKTRLTLTHSDLAQEQSREMHRVGWGEILSGLDSFLAKEGKL